jgi:hypothetical protein
VVSDSGDVSHSRPAARSIWVVANIQMVSVGHVSESTRGCVGIDVAEFVRRSCNHRPEQQEVNQTKGLH